MERYTPASTFSPAFATAAAAAFPPSHATAGTDPRAAAERDALAWKAKWGGLVWVADTLKQCYTAPVRDGLRGWGLHHQSIADQWVQRARDNELDRFPAQIRRFEAIWAGNERLLHHVGHKGPEPIASVAQTPFMLAAATFLINRNEFFKRYDRGAYDHVGKMAPTDRAQFNDLMDALEVCDNAAEADQILGRLHTFAQRTSPAPLRRF